MVKCIFDIEEEKLTQKHSSQSICGDQSLFSNFAMHSVGNEDYEHLPTHHAVSERQSYSSVLPRGKMSKENNSHDPVEKALHVDEKTRCSIQESGNHRRVNNDEFSRILYCQFHNFRMLLGTDLLIFGNEKNDAVSLHLWDVTRQVTPLTWLDNVMASVPELAICYHENSVVKGYKLLKTNGIHLLEGISNDGTPAFCPHVVQQNGLSVLKFLQENCKQDPGVYWLQKNAGEYVIQPFHSAIIPENHSSSACDDSSSSLPLIHRGKSDSLFSLGTLLYRIAHSLWISMVRNSFRFCLEHDRAACGQMLLMVILQVPNKRAKCAMFFKRCLDFLNESNHLVVRASAHEQFLRIILNYEDLELPSKSLHLECGITLTDAEEEDDKLSKTEMALQDLTVEASVKRTLESSVSASRRLITPNEAELFNQEDLSSCGDLSNTFEVSKIYSSSMSTVTTVSDPISSKLAAVHCVSEAIKSLRRMLQIQSSKQELVVQSIEINYGPPSVDLSICACGDADCIEICDIRDWLPKSKLDHKLWKLILLLGESYLALGQAHKEDGQLHQTLKMVELACSVYGSMPQHIRDATFISSMTKHLSSQPRSFVGDMKEMKSSCLTFKHLSSIYLFWAKAWTLVGDVYVEFHIRKGKETSVEAERKLCSRELRMSSGAIKEVQRLKKKLNQNNQNCSSCSLVNCSCQSDRASSGSSASSSSGDKRSITHGRKHSNRSHKSAKRSVPVETETEIASREAPRTKNGGIFKYLKGPMVGDVEHNLSAAHNCYEEARKALHGLPTISTELHPVLEKKAQVCNELGEIKLERKELIEAEIAFADAINAFREISDHTNIILIYCNLGQARRALAEEMISKAETFEVHTILHIAYKQALEMAKLEYCESLWFYDAAKLQLNFAAEDSCLVPYDLRINVLSEFGHTYLRLGMLLAREDATAEVYENAAFEDMTVRCARREMRKYEISANDAFRRAISLYETMGDLCMKEEAYAYFQLACYQRDCCLKFLESDDKKYDHLPKEEGNILLRIKQYVLLAKKNWQQALGFYGPETHPTMYLTILLEISALLSRFSSALCSMAMMDSALSCLLAVRHISETFPGSFSKDYPEQNAKFWKQLQMLLKNMLFMALSNEKSSPVGQPLHRCRDAGKLRELYKMSLKSSSLSDLHAMHSLWTA